MENVASVFAQEEIKLNFPGSGRTNYISGSTQDKISYHIGESFVGLIHDICPFFSTYTNFGSIFLHTKARKSQQKNLDKTASIAKNLIFQQFSATKYHKLYT